MNNALWEFVMRVLLAGTCIMCVYGVYTLLIEGLRYVVETIVESIHSREEATFRENERRERELVRWLARSGKREVK